MRAWATLLLGSAISGAAVLAQQTNPPSLPQGRGLDLIHSRCLSCHDMSLITQQRKSADDWITTIGVMADRGAQLTPDEMLIIEDYLIEHLSTDSASGGGEHTSGSDHAQR